MEYKHELVMPNADLPFKMFVFEGKDGNYVREKHWHQSVEIFAVFEGSLRFFLGEEEYYLEAGEFVLVNSNEVHSIFAPKPNRTIVLQIPVSVFRNYYMSEQFIAFSHEPGRKDKSLMELIGKMYEVYVKEECGYEFRVQSDFYRLLYIMVADYRIQEVSRETVQSYRRLNRLSEITAYLKENYQKELSLESLSEMFGYSPTYLSKMFQKYAGISYRDYLQNIRVECACRELTGTDYMINEIAMNHGFANGKAFAKAFRKKYGMLPNEYRKSKRE